MMVHEMAPAPVSRSFVGCCFEHKVAPRMTANRPVTSALRFSVVVLGTLAVIAGNETRVAAESNYPWCINKPDTPPQCRYATLEQCLADRLGKGGSCSPSPYPASAVPPQWTGHQRR